MPEHSHVLLWPVGVSQSFADYGEGEGGHRQIHSEEPASQPKVRPVRKDIGPAGAATDRSRSCSSLGVAAAILRINVWSEEKIKEKPDYMHNNPVERRLAEKPGDWPWLSWRYYYREDCSLLAMDQI